MSSLKFLAILVTAAVGFDLLCANPAASQHTKPPPEQKIEQTGDLQQELQNAQAAAKGSDSLEAAYDLLGVAGSAQGRNLKPLATTATTAFVDLIQRVTNTAHKKGGAFARDTLDQLVDLRFFARSQDIDSAVAALDGAMRSLFPEIAQAIQQRIDTSPVWDEKIEALNDLASLQASAAQVMMNDIATAIGAAFDAKFAVLDTLANQSTDDAERAMRVSGVGDAKRSREEQVADATNNNVDTVAAQIKAAGGDGSVRSDTGEDIPPDMAGETSCIETGYRAKPDLKQQRAHDRECVNSGRVPTPKRCTTENLSLACYAKLTNGEKITYVYRNTPEEDYFRKRCATEDILPGNRVTPGGIPFRGRDVSLAFVCSPAGGEPASD